MSEFNIYVVKSDEGVMSEVLEPSAPTVEALTKDHINEEIGVRLQTLMGAKSSIDLVVKVDNLLRESFRLFRKQMETPENWTQEDASRMSDLERLDLSIEAIRSSGASLKLTLPKDYNHPKYWP